jgi:polysaccharide pyruvyl transferase WcaK-like protein
MGRGMGMGAWYGAWYDPAMSTRRSFVAACAAVGLGSLLRAAVGDGKHVLLRSSWQTENIGDIAHTPGMLAVLKRELPCVKVSLWPSSVENGVEQMLAKAFPNVTVVKGSVKDGRPTTEALAKAWEECQFLLHGSGPSVVAAGHLDAWRKGTKKPYGILGVTIGETAVGGGRENINKSVLDEARFIFCRDTVSLEVLKKLGVTCPVQEFAPDATFAIDLKDEAKAVAYLKKEGLEERRFICAVPRLRYTPYHQFKKVNWDEARIKRVETTNAETKERDHAKLREAIVAYVRETGNRALLCPEMTYQLRIIGPLLYEPLPEDVKKRCVVRRDYWMPDEAGSVYARAEAVVSFEMHSPIIAAAHGTPAVHLRQPTDTSKGQMWRDVGLSDWIFEIDKTDGGEIGKAVLKIHREPAWANDHLAAAMKFAGDRHRRAAEVLGRALA